MPRCRGRSLPLSTKPTFIRDPLLFALSQPAPALASTPVRPSEALAVTLTGPPDQVAWTPSNASGLHEIFTEPIPNVQSGVVNDALYVPALSNASMSRAIASARDSGAGASLHGGGVRLVAALDMNDAGAVVHIRVAGIRAAASPMRRVASAQSLRRCASNACASIAKTSSGSISRAQISNPADSHIEPDT